MAEAAEDAIDFLLSSKGMMHRDTICQTVAEQEFDLEYSHLRSLDCTEQENPHGPRLTPQKTYSVRDAARLALRVNGPTGENLLLRKQRADAELQRSDTKQRIAAEQKAAAAALMPTTL
uniref:Uncharacterized protein n=1 Tax=Tetradesmus obliquus TaxID=3088 RepID=A0A383VI20_TETOB